MQTKAILNQHWPCLHNADDKGNDPCGDEQFGKNAERIPSEEAPAAFPDRPHAEHKGDAGQGDDQSDQDPQVESG